MKYRILGRTGWKVSEISFGAWAIGSAWGSVDDSESVAALHRAADVGVNFFDTADVYGDGRSEQLIGKFRKERSERIYVATKAGKRLKNHTAEGYNYANLTEFAERSLRNLQTDCLDLLQLHCPPTAAYYMPEVFGALDRLVEDGKIRHYGLSVKPPEEGLKAMDYPNVQTIQIIFSLFRQRPAELFLAEAKRRKVGVLTRVPLASGLLTGRMKRETTFAKDDHRNFNIGGAVFDRGETFCGVEYDSGLQAVEELRALLPSGVSMTQFALKWILMHDGVTCAIPGGRRPSQVEENAAASDLGALPASTMAKVAEVYERLVKPQVHFRW
jgi:aryl-alcohol dehydrogenase-like predicted oxidoreductase